MDCLRHGDLAPAMVRGYRYDLQQFRQRALCPILGDTEYHSTAGNSRYHPGRDLACISPLIYQQIMFNGIYGFTT